MEQSINTLMLSESDEDISKAGEILSSGGLCAIPTETVYGLAGNALNGEVVKRIFSAKGRPQDNPLIVHIADKKTLGDLVKEIPENAHKLIDEFWPGPLTVILPKKEIIPDEVSGHLTTVAVRYPSHPVACKIIKAAGVPLAAPSANISGKPSPTTVKHVYDDLNGRIDAIVDGGSCSVGVESTVVSFDENGTVHLLRPGAVTPEQIKSVTGSVIIDSAVTNKLEDDKKASSPGMKYMHYSPDCDVVILKGSFESFKSYLSSHMCEGTAAMCFEGEEEYLPTECITYGKEDEPQSQAQRLFDALHEAEYRGYKKVYARCPDLVGMGLAVYNRLIRAAGFDIIELEEEQ